MTASLTPPPIAPRPPAAAGLWAVALAPEAVLGAVPLGAEDLCVVPLAADGVLGAAPLTAEKPPACPPIRPPPMPPCAALAGPAMTLLPFTARPRLATL